MGEMPKGLRFSERSLWVEGDARTREVLARLARTRDGAKEVAAERDQLRQQVATLLLAVKEHRDHWSLYSTETDRALYSAADQVRKELEE